MSNIRHSTMRPIESKKSDPMKGSSDVEYSTFDCAADRFEKIRSEEGCFECRIFDIRSDRMHTSNQELPPSEATYEIFKDDLTYACIGEPASQKKVVKQNAAAKVLETLSTKYIFIEEKSEKCLITE